VSQSLYTLPGIQNVSGDIPSQLIHITGTAAPSSIVTAIQATGRDAILRGSGKPDSAAVCILETHTSRNDVEDKVRGLVRIVQVAEDLTIFDVAIRGLKQGVYSASIRACGNISEGAESTGPIWDAGEEAKGRGILGTLEISKSGIGSVFLDKPVAIWELIGRSIVVAKEGKTKFDKEDPDELVGVIARSAGVWENDKTVCSCSGKTVWEERTEQTGKGML
jgi:copper chaperone for superoxide dismutase